MDSRETMDWHSEAMAIIKDVSPHVTSIAVSDKLITDVGIYLNLKTLEGKELTCYLDRSGFKIVGLNFDNCDIEDSSEEEIYETIYSLIQSRSPGYTESFGNALVDKLNKLL